MRNKARLLKVVWEVVPDTESDEHLRRVFEILFKPSDDRFDESRQGRQHESEAEDQASDQIPST